MLLVKFFKIIRHFLFIHSMDSMDLYWFWASQNPWPKRQVNFVAPHTDMNGLIFEFDKCS